MVCLDVGLGVRNSSVVVGLGLLKSYRGMGSAIASCSGDCSCIPDRFELQHSQEVCSRLFLCVHLKGIVGIQSH